MPKKLPFHIHDLSGGMDATTDPALLNETQMAKIINGDLGRVVGAVSKRMGYKLEGEAVAPATDILGLGNLAKPDGTHKVVAVCGSDCYVYDNVNGKWDAQNQSLTGNLKAEFRTYLDYLFMVNYSNDTRVYDGSSWSTTVNLSAASGSPSGAPRAKFIEVYQNKVYLANVVIQPNAYPSRVYLSSLPNSSYEIDWDTTEYTGDYFEVDTNDNDMIRGLGTNSNRLLIFKEYSLHTWDNYSRSKVQGAPGTTSHRSIVNIDDWTYYFNRDGVFRWNGGTVQYISEPVKHYVRGISAATGYGVCAGEKNKHYLLYLGEVRNEKEGIEERRVLLDFDTTKGVWSINTLQTRPTVFLSCPTGAF